MRFSPVSQFLGLVLVPLALSSPLAERNTCSHDTLFNLFHKNHYDAELFCGDYMHYSTKTVTVYSHPVKTVTRDKVSTSTKVVDHFTTKTDSLITTKTKQSTTTKTSTATSDVSETLTSISTTTGTLTATSTTEIDSTVTSEVDSTTTTEIDSTITSEIDSTTTSEIDSTITSDLTTTTVITSTSTSATTTTQTGFMEKRNVEKRGNDPWKYAHPPPCPTGKYGASQLSSACSCLSLTKTTTHTVVKPSTYTKVIHSVKTVISSKPVTKETTTTKTSTAVHLDTTTKDVTSTSTSLTTLKSTESDFTSTTTTVPSTSDTTTTSTSLTTTSFTSLTTTSFTSLTTTSFTSLTTTTSVTTETDSTTTTTSTTSTACVSPTAFYLGITSSEGTYNDALLALTDNDPTDDVNAVVAADDGLTPNQFNVVAGALTDSFGRAAEQDSSETPYGPVFVYNLASSAAAGFSTLTCTLNYADPTVCYSEAPITCTDAYGNTIFSYCTALYFGSSVPSGCLQVTLNAIPVTS